ncbi:MAG TPA: hemerythrin domain-containing protein [Candidatus Paceibacterota bacterium]|nr:hemerythrin domain-containing protein [Candidatus Paceibacterota bacterium]
MPNAITMLSDDHREIEELFAQYETSKNFEEKQKIAETVFLKLEIHAKLEEEIFYPTVKNATEHMETEVLVDQSKDEHAEVKNLITNLRSRTVEEERYYIKFQTLVDEVMHHVEEEEEKLFPKVQEEMSDKLEEMGDAMEERKKTFSR